VAIFSVSLLNLKRGLLAKSMDMALNPSFAVKKIDIQSPSVEKGILAGRYLALMELYNSFDATFIKVSGSPRTLSDVQNEAFSRYQKLVKTHGFTLLGPQQVADKPTSVVLDYGRYIELMSIADDVSDLLSKGKETGVFERQLSTMREMFGVAFRPQAMPTPQ
jgi:hypothetical protein